MRLIGVEGDELRRASAAAAPLPSRAAEPARTATRLRHRRPAPRADGSRTRPTSSGVAADHAALAQPPQLARPCRSAELRCDSPSRSASLCVHRRGVVRGPPAIAKSPARPCRRDARPFDPRRPVPVGRARAALDGLSAAWRPGGASAAGTSATTGPNRLADRPPHGPGRLLLRHPIEGEVLEALARGPSAHRRGHPARAGLLDHDGARGDDLDRRAAASSTARRCSPRTSGSRSATT